MSPRRHPLLIGLVPRGVGGFVVFLALALLVALLVVAPAGAASEPTATPGAAVPAGGRLRLAAGVGAGAGDLPATATVVPPALPAPSPDPRLPGVAGTPTPAPGAATPAAAPARRTVVPTTPAPARPGTLAGVAYDASRDQVGARAKVLGYRDAQMKNGVPEADANRIALAHYKWDCQEAGTCDRTGLDLSRVDVNDAHANFGFNPECEEWGVTFRPWWGRWDPPAGQPGCDGAAGAAAGNAGAGSVTAGPQLAGGGYGLDPAAAAQAAIASLDWQTIVSGLFTGAWQATFDDSFRAEVQQLAAWLLANPDLTASGGQMGNIQGLAEQLAWAGKGLALLVFTVLVLQAMTGGGLPLGEIVGRAIVVVFALGAYRWLVGQLTAGTGELSATILATGADQVTTFGALIETLLAATPIFHRLVALVGVVCVVALIVVKTFGVVLLILAYVAGPLFLPLAIHPGAGRWTGLWAEHFLKALLWPVIFALEFRVFGALLGGISFTGAGGFDLGQGLLQIVVAVACLAVIAATPWGLHTQFTVARAVAIAQAHRARRGAAAPAEREAPREGRQERRPGVVGVTVREVAMPPARLASGTPGGAGVPPARLPRGA